jgi:hypothetical protein
MLAINVLIVLDNTVVCLCSNEFTGSKTHFEFFSAVPCIHFPWYTFFRSVSDILLIQVAYLTFLLEY